jgi:hypothetical protein
VCGEEGQQECGTPGLQGSATPACPFPNCHDHLHLLLDTDPPPYGVLRLTYHAAGQQAAVGSAVGPWTRQHANTLRATS